MMMKRKMMKGIDPLHCEGKFKFGARSLEIYSINQ